MFGQVTDRYLPIICLMCCSQTRPRGTRRDMDRSKVVLLILARSADIGLIGLAVMGQNLILNMNDHGFVVSQNRRCCVTTTF